MGPELLISITVISRVALALTLNSGFILCPKCPSPHCRVGSHVCYIFMYLLVCVSDTKHSHPFIHLFHRTKSNSWWSIHFVPRVVKNPDFYSATTTLTILRAINYITQHCNHISVMKKPFVVATYNGWSN